MVAAIAFPIAAASLPAEGEWIEMYPAIRWRRWSRCLSLQRESGLKSLLRHLELYSAVSLPAEGEWIEMPGN